MKAMIFAAGLGTRLRPLTDAIPKALVKVAGTPMLERLILRLKNYGVDYIVVNIHHHGDKVREFLADHDNFGITIHISDETSLLLDTGGGVVAAAPLLSGNEPILLHNADILTDIDYNDMLASHIRSGADATLLVADRTTNRYLLWDSHMTMRGWTDNRSGAVRPDGTDTTDTRQLAFGGVHIISPRTLNALCRYAERLSDTSYVAEDAHTIPVFSITNFYIDLCRDLRINGYVQPADTLWHDIGTLEKLSRAQSAWFSRHPSL